MTVRMKDIAQQLDVSVATVSLALSGNPRIPEATRVRVVQTARKMGYKLPHERRMEAECLAIILADASGPMGNLYYEAINGILDEAMTAEVVLQITQSIPSKSTVRGNLLHALRLNGAQGAIIIGGHLDTTTTKRFLEQDFPFICVGKRELPAARISWVATDYMAGARQAVAHLIGLGHRRIALLAPQHQEHAWFQERVLGYRLALDEAGLVPGPSLNWSDDADLPLSWPGDLIDAGVTAVLAIEHVLAARFLTACAAVNVQVPENLALVGFDDVAGSANLNPPLTTVRQPMRELGSTAARTLLSWLRGAQQTPVQIRLQPELVIRASCGAKMSRTTAEVVVGTQ